MQMYNSALKKQTIWLKNEDLNWSFSKEGTKNGQQTHEKTLSIASHQGNINKNHEISPYTCQNDKYQKDKCWQECREKGILVHCKLSIDTATVENSMEVILN